MKHPYRTTYRSGEKLGDIDRANLTARLPEAGADRASSLLTGTRTASTDSSLPSWPGMRSWKQVPEAATGTSPQALSKGASRRRRGQREVLDRTARPPTTSGAPPAYGSVSSAPAAGALHPSTWRTPSPFTALPHDSGPATGAEAKTVYATPIST